MVFYRRGLVIHDLYLGREKHFILHMEISQLELKNQAATQMLFAFPTAALSGHTVDTSLLIFLAMTKSSTCPFRSLCGPNRTEYSSEVNTAFTSLLTHTFISQSRFLQVSGTSSLIKALFSSASEALNLHSKKSLLHSTTIVYGFTCCIQPAF